MVGEISVNWIVAIAGGIVVISNAYEVVVRVFGKRGKKLHEDVKKLKIEQSSIKACQDKHDCVVEDHKKELKLLCKGILACLKGLEEKGCNGPVKAGIKELEEHLLDSAH